MVSDYESYIAIDCRLDVLDGPLLKEEHAGHDLLLDVRHDREQDQYLGEEVGEHARELIRTQPCQPHVNPVLQKETLMRALLLTSLSWNLPISAWV